MDANNPELTRGYDRQHKRIESLFIYRQGVRVTTQEANNITLDTYNTVGSGKYAIKNSLSGFMRIFNNLQAASNELDRIEDPDYYNTIQRKRSNLETWANLFDNTHPKDQSTLDYKGQTYEGVDFERNTLFRL
jgi:hypothetical protein